MSGKNLLVKSQILNINKMTQNTTINWSDEYLLNTWQPKIFNGRNETFEDYLYSEGVVSGRGGIKLPEKYIELTNKWNALNYARERLERKNGFNKTQKIINSG